MWLYGLLLLVVGCLAVPNLILSRQPNAKQILDKITPYQGWIGLVSAVWGLFLIPTLISSLSLLGHGLKGIIWFLLIAAMVVTQILLGFILGIGVLKSFIKDPTAQAKMDQTLAKVLPYQATLGLIAIADGAVIIINSFVHIIY